MYRLCAFLGWLELYRQEITFLDSGHDQTNLRLEKCLDSIRDDLSEGELNQAEDRIEWQEGLLFKEEQRAIGHAMICETKQGRTIMDYASFCTLIDATSGTVKSPWVESVQHFFCDRQPHAKDDFRKIRFSLLIKHLVKLVELLDNKRVSEELKAIPAMREIIHEADKFELNLPH